MKVELYAAASCPYSEAAREDLQWRGVEFVEYDQKLARHLVTSFGEPGSLGFEERLENLVAPQ